MTRLARERWVDVDAVAGPEVMDLAADRLDHTRHVEANDGRHLLKRQALAAVKDVLGVGNLACEVGAAVRP